MRDQIDMARFLIFLVGMLTTSRAGGPRAAACLAEDPPDDRKELRVAGVPDGPDAPYHPGDGWGDSPGWPSARHEDGPRGARRGPEEKTRIKRNGRPRGIPLRLKWAAVILVVVLIFRKV